MEYVFFVMGKVINTGSITMNKFEIHIKPNNYRKAKTHTIIVLESRLNKHIALLKSLNKTILKIRKV